MRREVKFSQIIERHCAHVFRRHSVTLFNVVSQSCSVSTRKHIHYFYSECKLELKYNIFISCSWKGLNIFCTLI